MRLFAPATIICLLCLTVVTQAQYLYGPDTLVNSTTTSVQFTIDRNTQYRFVLQLQGAGHFVLRTRTRFKQITSGYTRWDSISVAGGMTTYTVSVSGDSLQSVWLPDDPGSAGSAGDYWKSKTGWVGILEIVCQTSGNGGIIMLERPTITPTSASPTRLTVYLMDSGQVEHGYVTPTWYWDNMIAASGAQTYWTSSDTCLSVDSSTAGLYIVTFNQNCGGSGGATAETDPVWMSEKTGYSTTGHNHSGTYVPASDTAKGVSMDRDDVISGEKIFNGAISADPTGSYYAQLTSNGSTVAGLVNWTLGAMPGETVYGLWWSGSSPGKQNYGGGNSTSATKGHMFYQDNAALLDVYSDGVPMLWSKGRIRSTDTLLVGNYTTGTYILPYGSIRNVGNKVNTPGLTADTLTATVAKIDSIRIGTIVVDTLKKNQCDSLSWRVVYHEEAQTGPDSTTHFIGDCRKYGIIKIRIIVDINRSLYGAPLRFAIQGDTTASVIIENVHHLAFGTSHYAASDSYGGRKEDVIIAAGNELQANSIHSHGWAPLLQPIGGNPHYRFKRWNLEWTSGVNTGTWISYLTINYHLPCSSTTTNPVVIVSSRPI